MPSSARCSTARRVPRALSVTTLGMPVSTRLSTTVGRCWAITRIAESDIRDVPSTTPSTSGSARSSALRSTAADSYTSATSSV